MHVALYDCRDRKNTNHRIAYVVPTVAHAWATVLQLERKNSKEEREGYISYIKNAMVPEIGVLPDSDFHQQNANDFNAFWNVFGYSCEVYKGDPADEGWADDVCPSSFYWTVSLPPEVLAPTPASVESAKETKDRIAFLEQENRELTMRINEQDAEIALLREERDKYQRDLATANKMFHDIKNICDAEYADYT